MKLKASNKVERD